MIRFNQFDPVQQFNMAHQNMPMSSNAVLHHENWREGENAQQVAPGSHYKVGSKMKLGAATSTNFMKNQ